MHKQEVDLNIVRLFSVDEKLLENLLNLNAIVLTFGNENKIFKYIRINVDVA